MLIQKLYEMTLSKNNSRFSRIIYKINKLIVNIFYPIFVKSEYGIDSDHNVIISLTTYTDRINTVHLTIKTLLNQTYKPKMIVLWLSSDQFPNGRNDLPRKLLKLEEKGLTIKFCDELYPHKKYYYTIKENPNSAVVTVDDDVFYPENMLDNLIKTSKKYPDTVCCYWAHRFVKDNNGDVFSCEKWKYEPEGYSPSYAIVPTGVGGVLYPVGCFNEELFNKDAIVKCALKTDDLWLKVMEIMNDKKAVRVNLPARIPFSVLSTQKSGLYYENAGKNKNTVSWNALMKRYPLCRERLKNIKD